LLAYSTSDGIEINVTSDDLEFDIDLLFELHVSDAGEATYLEFIMDQSETWMHFDYNEIAKEIFYHNLYKCSPKKLIL